MTEVPEARAVLDRSGSSVQIFKKNSLNGNIISGTNFCSVLGPEKTNSHINNLGPWTEEPERQNHSVSSVQISSPKKFYSLDENGFSGPNFVRSWVLGPGYLGVRSKKILEEILLRGM